MPIPFNVQPDIVFIIIQNKNLPLLCLGRSLRGSAKTLIITRYYVLLYAVHLVVPWQIGSMKKACHNGLRNSSHQRKFPGNCRGRIQHQSLLQKPTTE